MAKSKKNLTDSAISELQRLLKDSDKKIRLRAISLILRHSDKIGRHDDPEWEAFVKSLAADLHGEDK